MASITDDRGYNQGFKITKALEVRTERRCRAVSGCFKKGKIKVLEIGGGIGLHASFIACQNKDAQILSTDICKPFIDQASKNNKLTNLKFETLDFNDKKAIREILLKEGQFDYIFGDGILHHLYYHLDETVGNLNRLLKKGGKMIFWEPNILNPYCFLIFKFKPFRKKANLEPAEMAFSKNHIKKILLSNGFDQIRISHLDFLLPNTPTELTPHIVRIGGIFEKIPFVNKLSQSIFISARKEK